MFHHVRVLVVSVLVSTAVATTSLTSCSFHDYALDWHTASDHCHQEHKELMCYSSMAEVQAIVDSFEQLAGSKFEYLWISKRNSCGPKESENECLYLRIVRPLGKVWHFQQMDCRKRCRFICCNLALANDSTTMTTTTTMKTTPTSKTTSTRVKPTRSSTTRNTKSSSATSTTLRTTTTNYPTSTKTHCVECCKSVTKRGIVWPETNAGETVSMLCPGSGHGNGTANWHCKASGHGAFWIPNSPDLSQCRSTEMKNIKDAMRHDNAITIVSRLHDFFERGDSEWMQEDDLADCVRIVSQLPDSLSRQFEKSVPESQRWELAKEIVYNCTSIIDSVLTQPSWQFIPNKEERLKLGSNAMQSVDSFGHFLLRWYSKGSSEPTVIVRQNLAIQVVRESPGKSVCLPSGSLKSSNRGSIVLHQGYDERLNPEFPVDIVYVNYANVSGILDGANGLLNSPVVSTSLGQNGIQTLVTSIRSGVEIVLVNYYGPEEQQEQTCVFWNMERNMWDETGCRMSSSNESHTVCLCNHLTNFAQVFNFRGIEVDTIVMFYITVIGCSVSIVCLAICIIVFTCYRGNKDHGIRYSIHKNLCLTLMLADITLLAGLDRTENKISCAVIAGFLHYFFLSAFSWMLLESVRIYLLLVVVFPSKRTHRGKYYIFGYGFPLLVVAITAAFRPHSYGTPKVCWLSNDEGAMWSFLGPVAVILVVNLIALIVTQWKASKIRKDNNNNFAVVKTWIRVALTLSPILGTTWLLGFLVRSRYGAYAFAVPNSLQGFFIFICHCLLDKNTRRKVMESIKKRSTSLETESSRSNKRSRQAILKSPFQQQHPDEPPKDRLSSNDHPRKRLWKKPWTFFYDWYPTTGDVQLVDHSSEVMSRTQKVSIDKEEDGQTKATILQWKKFEPDDSLR